MVVSNFQLNRRYLEKKSATMLAKTNLPVALHCPTRRSENAKTARRAIVSMCRQTTEDSAFLEHF